VSRDRAATSMLLVMLLAASLAATTASAHDQSFSYASIDWGRNRIGLRVTVHRDDAASLLGTVAPEALTERSALVSHAGRLAGILSERIRILGDGEALSFTLERAGANPETQALSLTFGAALSRPLAHLAIECALFPKIGDHETFLTVTEGVLAPRRDVLTGAHPRAEFYANGPTGALAAFGTYLRAGIHHIFVGPDHILFIVGLLLLGGGLARVLGVATAFTLAHSITLAIATFGWLSPPSWVVEPLIALSILYIGIENVRRRPDGTRGDWRIRIAFCFGLVHGFGFASVLREVGLPREALGWSLLAFNLGVEAGQAAIVLAVTPILAASRTAWPRVAPRAITACSWAIIAAGAFWFLERVIEPARILSARF